MHAYSWRSKNKSLGSILALACLGAIATTVFACSGPTTATSRPSPSASALQDAALKYASCMRTHGIDMPDPKVSGGYVQILPPKADIDSATYAAGDTACRPILAAAQNDGPNQNDVDRVKIQAAMLKFAGCMRSHGINIPDPINGQFNLPVGPGGIDLNAPDVKAADAACRHFLTYLNDPDPS
jgi:hypothetical protein